ncbi:Gfo/Idh/MocA family protein [Streptomyces sp. VRA16 Mangrove soil]|uniref:Gfo/Idh/MocA family protein n=1 Tax=Streptomyces sp. VRA16 Mangrove soil TaxID=2817434 RepID=UPI001A9CB9E2|nr:Gfo/Idh/MocA family oxidoreductase [Streptomyces sp. VRA16 Mangrove soil]MBO1334562.1 Gfo/Idh/MocA family oxidoreductase [Streptomyces sp. VRA16 Mangrove soil]
MGESRKFTVGILGTGSIFKAYAAGLASVPQLQVVRVADLDQDRARAAAEQFGIPAWGTTEQLLADDSVDIVVNITPPAAHAPLTDAALRAGKHVYTEKPLAATTELARRNMATAEASGRVLGGAPDTFLGAAGQTARAALDAGLIGTPFAATSFVRSSRAQTWHPDPTFLFQAGGGPVLDFGPYHVAALVNLLGPVTDVLGASGQAQETIAVTSQDRRVDTVDVQVATHATSVLRFASGTLATTMYSFDVWDSDTPSIEVYGTEGTLQLPDPNHFDLPVRIRRRDESQWRELKPVCPPVAPPAGTPFRGPGVLDLAEHLRGGPHRASAEFAYHVLDVLELMQAASFESGALRVTSTVDRPAAVPHV